MMTRRGAVLCIAALSAASLLAACSLLVPHWTYRYRLTIEVERDGKIFSGSSVIEVRREKGINGIGAETRGEAVAVDLGGGDTLFGLLRGNDGGEAWPYSVAHKAFADRLGTVDMVSEDALTRLTHLTGASATLSVDQYPMFVRFRNIRDPVTVEAVAPNNLAAGFGYRTNLRDVKIQLTDDKVTKQIEPRFIWWPEYATSQLDGRRYNDSQSLPNILNELDFKRGMK